MNENSLCDYLLSDSRDTFSSNFNVCWNLRFNTYGKVIDSGLDASTRSSFWKAAIIFQTSRNISVFGVCDWISQTRSVFWTIHSPACLSYKFASLLHCISHLSDLTLSSILLYSKRMQHHKLIHKINNLMFSDRSKIIFYQIPMK